MSENNVWVQAFFNGVKKQSLKILKDCDWEFLDKDKLWWYNYTTNELVHFCEPLKSHYSIAEYNRVVINESICLIDHTTNILICPNCYAPMQKSTQAIFMLKRLTV